ncbi:MAG: DMT family transporter [Anaerolineae bacterium]|nr:DMT family transporter [Anaerolineae bacterium]
MAETRAFPQKTPWQTYAVLAMGVLAVSMAAIFIRFAQAENMPTLLIAAVRLTLAALILTPIALRRYLPHIRRLTRTDFGLIAVSGSFLALHFILWISSLENTSVLISVVLVTTSPLWSAVLEAFFFNQRLSRLTMIGLLVAITGGILISLPTDSAPLISGKNPLAGSLMALGGALAVAVYLVIGRNVRTRLPVLPYIWMVYGTAAIVALIVVALTRTPVTGFNPQGYFWLVLMALVPQLIGHSSFNYALEYLSATYVGIASQIEPVASAIFAYFIFGEVPRELQLLGSLVIVGGVILASRGDTS